MIAILAVCAVLMPNPPDLQPAARAPHAARSVCHTSEDVNMPAYQVEQIIWWNYYGEWATGGSTAEAESSVTKQDAATGNEAAQKTSAK